MNQYIFLILIVIIQGLRGVLCALRGKNTNHLWVSGFIMTIPFEIGKAFGNEANTVITGTITPVLKITLPMILSCVLIFKIKSKSFFELKKPGWVSGLVLIILISIINPYNENPSASIVFAIFVLPHIFLFKIMSSFITSPQFIKGLYDSFLWLCLVQLVLAICFPLLEINAVTTLFHKGGAQWATREGTRNGAIGLFDHPGTLALFTMMASSFFIACYFFKYKKQLSFIMPILNVITVILTYSRTSYLVYIVLFFFLFFVKKNQYNKLFTPQKILKFFVPPALVICWLIFFSPLKDQFLKSDSGAQYLNRTMQYKMGLEMFSASPIVGVGLNSHMSYLAKNSAILNSVTKTKEGTFVRTNPIHNIHIVILAETGLIGFVLWVTFFLSNIFISKNDLARNYNPILSLMFIGDLLTIAFYGITGWAPLSVPILPLFLLISYFCINYRDVRVITIQVSH